MKIHRRKIIILVLFISLLLVSVAQAVPSAISLDKSVFGGGGGLNQAGAYTLGGTIGQAVVGMVEAPPAELCSGFWCMETMSFLYLPVIRK
jgi:hypothetical protein